MRLDIHKIRRRFAEKHVLYLETVGSTMTEAARLADSGATSGTVILAEEQTAGIGRLGRAWESERELGVYCSILLRLPLPPDHLPIINLVLGLAAAEAIEKTTNLICDLRWPNDVLIRQRKVAGILAQLIDTCVIAGIGINVNQVSFASELRTPATSLRIENGSALQPRDDLAIHLIQSIDAFSSMLQTEGPAPIIRAFTAASSYAFDRRVLVEDGGRKGITAGLDESGFLLVRFDGGGTERVAAGGVRPAN